MGLKGPTISKRADTEGRLGEVFSSEPLLLPVHQQVIGAASALPGFPLGMVDLGRPFGWLRANGGGLGRRGDRHQIGCSASRPRKEKGGPIDRAQ